MRPRAVSVILLFAGSLHASPPTDPVYAPLWLYQGTWHVAGQGAAPGTKPDELRNQCALLGRFFACQQTVNGQAGGLIIFIPAGKPGQYYTQNVRLEGFASGRGNLEISGGQWTYLSTRNDSGKTTYYRTINVFTGKNRIHYEQSESPDGKNWKVTGGGDEVRVTRAGR